MASSGAMPDGRFAPSPTGDLHIGNLRTALLAWLLARSDHARFVIRMEDLDQGRVRQPFVARQLADLQALGLDWDGEVTQQSDHLDRYRDAIDQLVRAGVTYPCYCTRREIAEAAAAPHGEQAEGTYPGLCRDLTATERAHREEQGRPPALRIRGEQTTVTFHDRICGPQRGIVDDVVILRNDGTPAYNLAVIVDDVAQGIGEVVRGDDLLASTPRQLHLAHLLGLAAPTYAHVPLALGPTGARLAKRDGAVTLADLAAQGQDAGTVLGRLLASIGLLTPDPGVADTPDTPDGPGAPDSPDVPGGPVAPAVMPAELGDLVARFRLGDLPREPWYPLGRDR